MGQKLNRIKENWKYCVLALLFLGLIINHLYFNTQKISSTVETGKLILSGSEANYQSEIPTLTEGDFYRLNVSMRADPDASSNQSQEKEKLSVALQSEFGVKKEIGKLSAPIAEQCIHQEIIFESTGPFNQIILTPIESTSDKIYMSDLSFTRLAISNLDEAAALKASVQGITENKPDFVIGPGSRAVLHKFDYKNEETYGQVFKADNEYLSSVGMKLKIKGKGGLVSFFVQLREAKLVEGKFQIDPRIIQTTEFHPYDPQSYVDNEGIWRFPLPAHLEKGKYYFVGINNLNSQSDYFNNLSLIGTKGESGRESYAGAIGTDNFIEPEGELYLKLYTSVYTLAEGERVLPRVKFEDVGDFGRYQYRSGVTSDSLLDLYSASENKNGRVFFDGKTNAILGYAQNDIDYVYKFNMLYPIKEVDLSLNDLGENYVRPLIYYSFDNKNWQKVDQIPEKKGSKLENDNSKDPNIVNPKQYGGKIFASGSSKEFYIKVTYNSATVGLKEGLFGVKNLTVAGKVDTE